MAEVYVQVPPNSTGEKIRNVQNNVGGNLVDQQVITMAKSDGTLLDDPATSTKQDAGNASLAAIAGKDFATQTTLAALLAALALVQGAVAAGATGPMVQGIVSDAPNNFTPDVLQPLSLTTEGRLRVSTVSADVNRAWQHTLDSPWPEDNPFAMEESLYV